MKWLLRELYEYTSHPLCVSENLNLSDEIMKRYGKYVISVDNDIHVDASVFSEKGDAVVSARVTGKIVVPSSRSLTPVDLPLDFNINEVYVSTQSRLKQREDDGEIAFLVDEDGSINFNDSIVDNLILQIPMHILSPDELENNSLPEGNGWEVITEDEFNQQEANHKKVDPRLAKLKNFFSDDDNQ